MARHVRQKYCSIPTLLTDDCEYNWILQVREWFSIQSEYSRVVFLVKPSTPIHTINHLTRLFLYTYFSFLWCIVRKITILSPSLIVNFAFLLPDVCPLYMHCFLCITYLSVYLLSHSFSLVLNRVIFVFLMLLAAFLAWPLLSHDAKSL